jgi:hypothetical protein
MSNPRIVPLLFVGLLAPALLLGAPPQAFEFKQASVKVGDGWIVRMSTRVEQDPDALAPEAGLQTPDDEKSADYVETATGYRCRVLSSNDQGEVQLETRFAKQTVVVVTDDETSKDTAPARTITEWGQPEVLVAPTEVGPCSLLERKSVRLGERWTTEGTLVIGGVAPVKLRVVYTVEGVVEKNGESLLRITTSGKGSTPAEGGATISVETQGVLLVNPECVDRPRKVAMVYRFKVTGGQGPDVATRTTIRLESKKTS